MWLEDGEPHLWQDEVVPELPVELQDRAATPQQVMDAARDIYAGYPDILKALGL